MSRYFFAINICICFKWYYNTFCSINCKKFWIWNAHSFGTIVKNKEPGTVRPIFGPQIRGKIERGFTWYNHNNYALWHWPSWYTWELVTSYAMWRQFHDWQPTWFAEICNICHFLFLYNKFYNRAHATTIKIFCLYMNSVETH